MEPIPQLLTTTSAPQPGLQRAPMPETPRPPAPARRSGTPRRRLLVAAGAVLIALGTVLWWPRPPASDAVSAATQQRLGQAFQAALPTALPIVKNAREAASAREALHLPPAQHAQLQADLTAGTVHLAWVQAWDHMDEDGDVIHLTSLGYTVEVPLRHAPTLVPLPVASEHAQVVITGVRDGGGGGITAALQTADGRLLLPILAPGQPLVVPLR